MIIQNQIITFGKLSLINLDPIGLKEYQKFILRDIKNGERISNEFIERIYNLFEGHTWYIQNIFHRLYSVIEKGEECTMKMIEQCVRSTVNSFEPIEGSKSFTF